MFIHDAVGVYTWFSSHSLICELRLFYSEGSESGRGVQFGLLAILLLPASPVSSFSSMVPSVQHVKLIGEYRYFSLLALYPYA